ncbi:branched-chain amino acid ABC transporter permease [Hydrogenophaga sp.]|uniref:branched-chain amino acid ABC transporter permease n=1 Tax=Hydrogenophaga sp. TaxID=1904254 RepID=UPI002727D349|nr:branched-chain amino acid ABC transporter permease [Hydrogenophaga sp.]MDO9435989.1 branched-chain amino acid ABC transporter permease [Hydrogenophaga sp.]
MKDLLLGQLVVGLINGSFYALLSLGIAVIFGMLRIVNFVHGAQYMLGALAAWFLLNMGSIYPELGLPSLNYWWSLLLVPIVLGGLGMLLEVVVIRRIYKMDHLYGLLLTLGLGLMIEGLFQAYFGTAGRPYSIPTNLSGRLDLGFMSLPIYRAWVIIASLLVCFTTWYAIEKTKLGSYLRSATEDPVLVQAFGIRVPRLLTMTYGAGVALAGLAGVMAAPIYQVSPLMGQNIVVTVFAVVIIGGMSSIGGAIVTGIALGLLESAFKVFYPAAASSVIFVAMAVVLLFKPHGLFGRA